MTLLSVVVIVCDCVLRAACVFWFDVVGGFVVACCALVCVCG